MAWAAKCNEIIKAVGFFPILVKFTPGYDVMYVKSLPIVELRNTTSLTDVFIALACSFGPFIPSGTAVILMSTKPGWAIFTSRISRCTLPFTTASDRTKIMLAKAGWVSIKRNTTTVTDNFDLIVLRMIFPRWPMLTIPLGHTLLAAEMVFEALDAIQLYSDKIATVITRKFHFSSACSISACDGTVFLLWVVARCLERLTTILARLGKIGAPCLICTSSRTKSHLAVGSFLNQVSTIFAPFHILNYRQSRGIVKYV